MNRWVTATTIAILISACADTHQVVRNAPSGPIRLTPADSIFIAIPADGSYGANTYRGSGQNTAQIIYSAFARHTRSVKMGRSAQSFDESLAAARTSGQKYLVYPTILHWEDRATEWSAIPDKVDVKIELVDIATGESLVSGVVTGKSGLATFGGDHPQDLLPKPVAEFVSSLY